MKRIFFAGFLSLILFSTSYSQGQIINVTERFGTGLGTLYDAINKANASSAYSSGTINFTFYIDNYYYGLNVIFPGAPLPVLLKDNWIISKSATLYYSDPQNPFGYSIEDVIINGQGSDGPGILVKGKNSVCQIPLNNFTGFLNKKYVITNTNDSGDGSLRQAMEYSNSKNSNDTIIFNIPGEPPYVINLTSALPEIRKGLIIDGSTQSNYKDGDEVIVLNGNNQFIKTLQVEFQLTEIIIHKLQIFPQLS